MKNIQINVWFFGSLKDFFGEQVQLQIPNAINLGGLMHLFKEKSPLASQILSSSRIAVDNEFQDIDFVITHPHEIAFLPPYSGG